MFIYLLSKTFLVALGLCGYTWAFSNCGEGILSGCSAQTSLCAVFSCCRAQALGTQASVGVALGSVVVLPRLRYPQHVESSRTRDCTCVSYASRQILIHCITMEVPVSLGFFFK